MKKVLLLLLFGLVGNVLSYAQQSFLDPLFGSNGFVYPIINGSQRGGVTALEYSNSKILAITGGDLSRYNENGTLDVSFANNGIYGISSLPEAGKYLRVQPDGKILLGGDYQPGSSFSSDFFIARILSNGGGLDANFGMNGVNIIPYWGADFAKTFTLQPDGKIVMTGNSYDDIRTIRCNADGSIDSSFGANGGINTNVGYYSNTANSVVVLPDGKILVAGYGDNTPPSGNDFVVIRYLSNGMLDTTFNHIGILYANNNNPGYGLLRDMKVQPDGKILLAGGSSITYSGFLVVRLNADGTKDTSFNHTGEQMIEIDGSGTALKLALQADGKIVVGGFYETAKENWGLIRLLSNGTLDSSFGDYGKIRLPLGDRQERIYDMVIQPDGKILACGYYEIGTFPNIQNNMIIARFIADGANNILTISENNSIDIYPNPATDNLYITDLAKQISQIALYSPDGKLLVTQIFPYTDRLATEGLADGIYYLKLNLSNQQTLTKKLIIQKN